MPKLIPKMTNAELAEAIADAYYRIQNTTVVEIYEESKKHLSYLLQIQRGRADLYETEEK